MSPMPEALVAFSDSEHGQILATILGHCGLMPVLCSSLKQARTLLDRKSIRLVFCEDRLTDGSFRDMLQVTAQDRPGLPLVVFSRHPDPELPSAHIQSGATDSIAPPFYHTQIEQVLHRALYSMARAGGMQA